MIITLNELPEVRNRHANETIALTSGTFDLLHSGHLNYLEAVQRHGDVVVVLMSGDERVKARKGDKRPVINEMDRARLLDSLKFVNYVLVDPSKLDPAVTDPLHAEILAKLRPDFYITDGPDPRFYKLMDQSQLIILDRMNPEPSTTSIIKRIQHLD